MIEEIIEEDQAEIEKRENAVSRITTNYHRKKYPTKRPGIK